MPKNERPSKGYTQKIGGEISSKSEYERELDAQLLAMSLSNLPLYGTTWNLHSLVTMKRQTVSRILYYDNLYRLITEVPGVICEFGVQWGATLTQLINLRGIYEPYNYSRKIIGFDTFLGFPAVHNQDGVLSAVGDYATFDGYEETLNEILRIHEEFSPISQIPKFELVKGDASETFASWLEDNPHAIISMAIFDMDIYKPTKDVLNLVIPRLTKGSVLVFDELNCPSFPGETKALDEVIGLNNLRLQRFPHQPYGSWAIWGD
jgi:hypothetical protein